MKRMGILSLACAAAFVMACNGNARTDNRTDSAAVGTAGEADRAVHDSDKDFVNHMLSDGMAEVELGKMARERAVNPEVKQFGQMMVDDHSKAGDELKDIARQYGVQPTPTDRRHASGFDRPSYRSCAVHSSIGSISRRWSMAIRTRSTASRGASTALPPLKDRITNKDQADKQVVPERSDNAPKASFNAWAANALPIVRQHLDEAKRLDDQLDRNRTTTRNDAAPATPRK